MTSFNVAIPPDIEINVCYNADNGWFPLYSN